MASLWAFTSIVLLGIAAYGVHGQSNDLSRLANHIKSNSNPDVPPPSNGPVRVYMSYLPLNVAYADEEARVVEFEGVTYHTWQTDITWNSTDYGNTEFISLPRKYFWIPPIYIFTTAVKAQITSPPQVTIYSNGTVGFMAMRRQRALCDLTNIDTGASCNSQLIVWGYVKEQVLMISDPSAAPERRMSPYFSGSKYETIGGNMGFYDYPFEGRVYQVANVTSVIRRKPEPHNHHGPFRAMFQFGH